MEINEKLKAQLHGYYEAFHLKDWDRFAGYLSDRFTYYTDKSTVMDKDRFITFLKGDKWNPVSYSVTDENIYTAGSGDMALTLYKTSFTGIVEGKEYTVSAVESTIFVKEESKWKILHSHTSNR